MLENTPAGPSWLDLPAHHRWLRSEEDRLLTFHERHALNAPVGFDPLDRRGSPLREAPRELWATARYVHSFSIAHLMGRPGADAVAGHGLEAIDGAFRDRAHGGWFASIAPDGSPVDTAKSSYAHAFVLLAGASAAIAGLDPGAGVLDEADAVIREHLWRPDEGAAVDGTARDWSVLEPGYRGQNANMHLAEASMAAYEASGRADFLARARSIASLVVDVHARAHAWRVPEHFDDAWRVDWEYNAERPDDPFRPYGSLVGHWCEWARLLLQLHALPDAQVPWAPGAAAELFDAAVREGWDPVDGGMVYSVSPSGVPVNRDRMHWAVAEAIGAAAGLARATGEPRYEGWYRRFWSFVATRVIDHRDGGWWHQLSPGNTPAFGTWPGKPDLYHALQATLYARSDLRHGVAEAARLGRLA